MVLLPAFTPVRNVKTVGNIQPTKPMAGEPGVLLPASCIAPGHWNVLRLSTIPTGR